MICETPKFLFFFFNDTATTEIYTLSLHDALPIFGRIIRSALALASLVIVLWAFWNVTDRKSTRLNSSHSQISYAVFCLKKKTTKPPPFPSAILSRRLFLLSPHFQHLLKRAPLAA